jgi:hypothetical protein
LLEDRRPLAVAVTFTPQGEATFLGDAQPDNLEIFVENGLLRYLGASPVAEALNIPVGQVTALKIELGGGDDRVVFSGSTLLTFAQASVNVDETEWIEFTQSLSTGGEQSYAGNVFVNGGGITLSSASHIIFENGSQINSAPSFDGQDFLTWQLNVGRTFSPPFQAGNRPFTNGDWNGSASVNGADLAIWREYFGPRATSALNIDAVGQLRLLGSVGEVRPLQRLTMDADGGIVLGAGPIILDGNSSTFNSPVVLTADTTINDTGDVTFNSSVDSDGLGNWDLTVNTDGATIFNDIVGGNSELGSLITDAAGETRLAADVNTAEDQVYNDPVTLLDNVVLLGDDVTFANTLNGGFNLTVNTQASGGTTSFLGAVGQLSPLVNLATNVPGQTVIGGNVTTSQDQVYNDAVKLSASITLAGNDIRFMSTVDSQADGGAALIVNTTGGGETRFAQGAGTSAGMRLLGLTTNMDGQTSLGGNVVTTQDQEYRDAVKLTAPNVVLTGQDVRFFGTVGSLVDGSSALTVNASGNTEFRQAVGMAGMRLLNLTTDFSGQTLLGDTVTTTVHQTYNDPVALTGHVTLLGQNITFGSTVNSDTGGPWDLTVNTQPVGGITTFAGAVGGAMPLRNLTVNGPGATVLGGNVSTQLDQTYNDAVRLAGPVTIAARNVSFNSTVDNGLGGPWSLTVNNHLPAGGNTVLADDVGGLSPLQSLSVNNPGTTFLGSGVGTVSITTVLDQAYNGPVKLVPDLVSLTARSVHFFETVGSNTNDKSALSVNATGNAVTGNIFFDDIVGTAGMRLLSLATNALGTTFIGLAPPMGPTSMTVDTAQDQSYNSAVKLASTNVTLAGNDVRFFGIVGSAVDGFSALAVNTMGNGETLFAQPVGAGAMRLASLTTNADGTTVLGSNVTTAGSQTYNDPVTTTAANLLLTAGMNVAFAQTLTGPGTSLTVNAPGTTSFNGSVSLANLATDMPGSTALGANVTTSGDQTYNDPATLTNNVMLLGDDVTFNGTVNGAFALTVSTQPSAGTTTFAQPVGGTTPLAGLTTNGPGGTLLGSLPGPMTVSTTGDQTYNDPVKLVPASVTLIGNDVRFLSTVGSMVDGFSTLAVNTTGNGETLFAQPVGGAGMRLASLTTNADGTTVLGSNPGPMTVTTSGDQVYNDAVKLVPAIVTLTGGNVLLLGIVGSMVDGFSALTVTAPGVTQFGASVGPPGMRLKSIVTDPPGQTRFGSSAGSIAITTTEDQTYGDPAVLLNHTNLMGRDITFNSTVNSGVGGPWDLNVNATRTATFMMAVGGGSPLRDLVVSTGSFATPGPFTLNVPVTVTRDVLVEVRESDPAAVTSASDDLILLAAAQLTAGRDVRFRAGDDISIASAAAVNATGTLTLHAEFGDNDAFGATIDTAPIANAVGVLRGVAGIAISGGNQADIINLQAERLNTPNTATLSGLLGDDQFNLLFADNLATNFLLNVGILNILGESTPPLPPPGLPSAAPIGMDRLTIDHTGDAMRRVVSVAYQTQFQGGHSTIDGSNARFTGYGTTAFNTTGMEKYRLLAGSGGHDHINISASDQSMPSLSLEQQIFVSSDASRQWELDNWESGHLIGSNVRDAILNDTAIPMLIEGRAGNDTIVGGSNLDVIFGGAGAPLFRVGPPASLDPLLSDASLFPAGVIEGPNVPNGDYLVGRAGNDFLFADVDLFRDGVTLWGQVTLDVAGERDVIDGGTEGVPLGPETNHGAQFGVNDIVRRITGMLVDGGATKDVNTWLRASPMLANLDPDLTSDAIDMLIDAAFRSNTPAIGKVGLLSPPHSAILDDFMIRVSPQPATSMALTSDWQEDDEAVAADGGAAASETESDLSTDGAISRPIPTSTHGGEEDDEPDGSTSLSGIDSAFERLDGASLRGPFWRGVR